MSRLVSAPVAEFGHGVAGHQLEGAEAGDLGGRQVGLGHDHEVDELHLDALVLSDSFQRDCVYLTRPVKPW